MKRFEDKTGHPKMSIGSTTLHPVLPRLDMIRMAWSWATTTATR